MEESWEEGERGGGVEERGEERGEGEEEKVREGEVVGGRG